MGRLRGAAVVVAMTVGTTAYLVSADPAPAAAAVVPPNTVTFSYTGSVQTYPIPAGVRAVRVTAEGARGGGVTGGEGGTVTAIVLTPPAQGDKIQVRVGGAGSSSTTSRVAAGGYNGGGLPGSPYFEDQGVAAAFGGGGASDIRQGTCAATVCDLSARTVVAGGGGGGGDVLDETLTGGDGGSPAAQGTTTAPQYAGRPGGGATAVAGTGGDAGTPIYSSSTDGEPGTLGVGGTGGLCLTGCADDPYDYYRSGAGGGGGYHGGGGGGGGGDDPDGQIYVGGPGGGGSSHVSGTARYGMPTMSTGGNSGHGSVVITPGPVITGSADPGAIGTPYSMQLSAIGASAPYSGWTVFSGALPPGLALSSSGLISGAPTTVGTYTFTVLVEDALGIPGLAQYSIVVGMPAPTGVTAVLGTANAIDVSWSAVAGADSYKVHLSTVPTGPFTTPAPGTCATPTTTACTATGLTAGTIYYFVVTAVDGSTESAPSDVSSGVRALGVPGPITRPVATVDGDLSMAVVWSGPAATVANPVDSVEVQVAEGQNVLWLPVAGGTCATAPASGCSATNLSDDTGYRFRVVATNAVGERISDASDEAVAQEVPGLPQQVSSIVRPGVGVMGLTWVASLGATSHRVYYREAPAGSWVEPTGGDCVDPTTDSCTLTGLTPGTAYEFAVVGVNDAGDSQWSDAASQTAMRPPGTPGQPTVTPTGDGSVEVAWTEPDQTDADPVVGYQVVMSTDDGGTFSSVPAGSCATAPTSPCTVSSLMSGQSYRFMVAAVNDAGEGASEPSDGVVPAQGPDAPTDVVASIVAGNGSMSVAWTPPSGTVDSYRIYVRAGAEAPAIVTDGTCADPPTVGPCTVTGLTAGSSYTFAVAAVADDVEGTLSQYSDVKTAIRPAARPPTPSAAVNGPRSIQVSWTPVSGTVAAPVTGYRIYMSENLGPYDLITTGGCHAPTTSPCTVTGLTAGSAYYVKVTTVNPAGESTVTGTSGGVIAIDEPSEPSEPDAAPGRPTAVVGTPGTSSIVVRWTAPDPGSGIVDYVVTADPGPATCTTEGTECVFGAVAGTPYTFTVVARGGDGHDSSPSDPSEPVTASPPVLPAQVPSSDATLTTDKGRITSAEPGQQLVVIGEDFAPYSTVRIVLYSEPTLLATAVTDGNGDFRQAVGIPAGLSAGEHTFVALGVDADGDPHTMTLTVTVAEEAALAVSGKPVFDLVRIGAGLILVGLVLAVTGRRVRPFRRAG